MDIDKYKEVFAGGETGYKPEYDCSDLFAMGYEHVGHFNKTNPKFEEYKKDLEKEMCIFKIIDLDEEESPDNKNMVDIWIKEKTSFRKVT